VAAAIGPGPGEWPQDTACWNLKISKIRRLWLRLKKWIFGLFLHGNYIEDIFPMKKRKCNFSEVRARPKWKPRPKNRKSRKGNSICLWCWEVTSILCSAPNSFYESNS
jgi:hypothetical protein